KYVSDATNGRVNPLMNAMGPNVAGVIGSAVAAGALLALVGEPPAPGTEKPVVAHVAIAEPASKDQAVPGTKSRSVSAAEARPAALIENESAKEPMLAQQLREDEADELPELSASSR